MKARQEKEKLTKEKNTEKSSKDYIEALYYHCMYYSEACLKGTTGVVTTAFYKVTMPSNAVRYHALKENICLGNRHLGESFGRNDILKIFLLYEHTFTRG